MSIFSPIPKNLLNQIKMEEINSLDWEEPIDNAQIKKSKGEEPEFTKIKGSKDEMIKKIEQATKPIGSRYHLGYDENKFFGHIITAERTENGLKLYDPQNNEIQDLNDIIMKIMDNSSIELLRVDRLLLNTNLLNDIAILK